MLAKKNWCAETPGLGTTWVCSCWALSLTSACIKLILVPLWSAFIGMGMVQQVSGMPSASAALGLPNKV